MRIVENIETIVIVPEVKGVVCNCCGDVFEPIDANLTQQFNLTFGYGSEYANNAPWKFDVCETCLINFVKTFKHVPDNFKCEPQFFDSAYDTDHNLHQELFEQWKLTGEWYDSNIDNPWIEDYRNEESEHEDGVKEKVCEVHTNPFKIVK